MKSPRGSHIRSLPCMFRLEDVRNEAIQKDLTDERFKVAQEPSSRNRSQEDASEEGCAAPILTAPVHLRASLAHRLEDASDNSSTDSPRIDYPAVRLQPEHAS